MIPCTKTRDHSFEYVSHLAFYRRNWHRTFLPVAGFHRACFPSTSLDKSNYLILKWWRRVDSNHWSLRQQIYSLPPLAAREHLRSWWSESNWQPADYKSAALPLSHTSNYEIVTVLWWRRVDSNHWSLRQQIYSLPPLAAREHLHFLNWQRLL